jgi:hypothetical protein
VATETHEVYILVGDAAKNLEDILDLEGLSSRRHTRYLGKVGDNARDPFCVITLWLDCAATVLGLLAAARDCKTTLLDILPAGLPALTKNILVDREVFVN